MDTPSPSDLDSLRQALDCVRARIATACTNAGRDPASVRLLPVSKTVDAQRLRLLHALGVSHLGENKVQEARTKSAELADLGDLRWVIIGHLQTNKAKDVAQFCHEFQALDSLRVAAALETHLQRQGRALDVLVQINTSGEVSKFGLAPEDALAFVRELPAFSALRVRGLMTLAQFSTDADVIRPCFARLRTLRDQLRQDAPDGILMDELSMGMSGDFTLAIAEGATTVRVGTAIFGRRHTPDSLYWPEAIPS